MREIFRSTDWRFVTSGGAELTVGAMRLAFVGGNGGAFYVRKSQGPVYRLPYAAIVVGGGLGVSTAGIVSVAASLPWAPGGGFTIYRNPLRTDSFGLEDFEGTFVACTISITGLIYSRSCTVLAFGAPRWVFVTAALQLHAILASCAGYGVLWGSAITNAAAVGVSILRGEILSPQREEGETSFSLPSIVEKVL